MFKSLEEARAYLPPQDVDCIVYHNVCADGITSAFAGWRFLKDKKVQFVRGSYDDAFSVDNFPGKNILVVDFSFTKEQLEALEKAGKKVLVLDHHEKALKELDAYPHAFVVDEKKDKRSGAGLSWQYFYPDQPIPKFFQLVQDRDVWKFEYSETKAFSEAYWAHLLACKFNNDFPFEQLEQYFDAAFMEKAIQAGNVLLIENAKKVQQIANTASLRTYQGNTLWFVYSKNGSMRSEVGHVLCERPGDAKYAAIWWEDFKDPSIYHVSFRSSEHKDAPETDFNVNLIANQFGGGGHSHASSCRMSTHPESIFLAAPQPGMHVAYQQEKQDSVVAEETISRKRKFEATSIL